MRRTMLRRGSHITRHAPVYIAERGEPRVGYCTCAEPDLRPLGGWWPESYVCCHQCSKPRLVDQP